MTGTVLLGLRRAAPWRLRNESRRSAAHGPGEGNVIAGASFYYGLVLGGSGHVVYGNFIGTDVTGTIDLGNYRAGISGRGNEHDDRRNRSPGQGNTIAFNGTHLRKRRRQRPAASGSGSAATASMATRRPRGVERPRESTLLVGNDGVTPNDDGRRRMRGPTAVQNYPILTSAGPALGEGAGTHIVGVLNSTASTTFDIDFYANPSCASRPQEYLEGQDYIGSTASHDRRLRQRHDRRDAAFTVEAGAPHLRDGDGSRREHVRVLAAADLLDEPGIGTAGRRHQRHDQRHALRGRRDGHDRRPAGDQRRRRRARRRSRRRRRRFLPDRSTTSWSRTRTPPEARSSTAGSPTSRTCPTASSSTSTSPGSSRTRSRSAAVRASTARSTPSPASRWRCSS